MRSLIFLSYFSLGCFAQMGPAGLFSVLMNKVDNSPDGQCHQLSMFGRLVDYASDAKIQDAFTNGDETKKAMATGLITMLNAKIDPIKSDQSRVDGCKTTVDTDNRVLDCLTRQGINDINTAVAADTPADAPPQTAAKKDMMMKIAAAFADRVNAINSNAELSDYCAGNVDMKCIQQKIISRYVTLAADDAAVNSHFNGNATQAQKFKDVATKAQQKLDSFKADQKLQDECGKMPNILPINIDSVTLDDLPKGGMGVPQM